MKTVKASAVSILLFVLTTGAVDADSGRNGDVQQTVAEILLLRPAGLVGTLLGSALFVAATPLTALASIAPPHDAFPEAADALVVTPFEFTFTRPFGDVP